MSNNGQASNKKQIGVQVTEEVFGQLQYITANREDEQGISSNISSAEAIRYTIGLAYKTMRNEELKKIRLAMKKELKDSVRVTTEEAIDFCIASTYEGIRKNEEQPPAA